MDEHRLVGPDASRRGTAIFSLAAISALVESAVMAVIAENAKATIDNGFHGSGP